MIHINADIGEIPAHIEDGTQESLLRHLTQVNIACGGHAGDDSTMRASIGQANRYNLQIGAHPGYPDPANFGRLELDLPLDAVTQAVFEQITALSKFTNEIQHVKPHGALYNQAVHNEALARAIAKGAARFSRNIALVGLANSKMLDVFAGEGFRIQAEAFADRRYNADGTLVSRTLPNALITDPAEAAQQAVRLARSGTIQTICVHGDTPGAAAIARAVAQALIT
ncbi:MAG: LamB/YcsF family protein [Acidobacteria bacterium]|nr:LamB/YcsF family protein [Acidobacteriota bacterium]